MIRIPVLAYLPAFLAAEMMGTGDRLRVPAAVLAAAAPVSMAAVLGLGGIWLGGAAGAGALLGVATRLPGSLPRTILRTAVPLLTVVLMLAAGGDFLPGWKDRAYGSVRYHARRAQGLEAAGQYGAALEARRRAVELSPQAPSARYDLGVILVRLGENRAAADAFAESVRLDPTFAEARENLGEVLLALGETEEARAAFGEAAREWERRLETGELSAFGRRQARERIDRLRDLAGAGSRPAPDQFR
ncbi:MAG: tetratricopeptide repeat protein [Acidobacteria bacterium]|nr:tetratricopeptide repeat protein [Acidobacteriota bacterium]